MKRDIFTGRRVAVCAIALALGGTAAAHAQSAGQWRDGPHVYAKVCSNCHESGIGPVIKGRGFSPAYYQRVVRSGLRAMPAFRPTEIDDAALRRVAEMLADSPASGGRR